MNSTRRHCFALDLKDDEDLIAEYEHHHQAVWPEILQSIQEAGITAMEIYRLGSRLFMIMEVGEDFSFDKKAEMDNSNPIVQQWEELMWKYQQALPGTKAGEKWMPMKKIFTL